MGHRNYSQQLASTLSDVLNSSQEITVTCSHCPNKVNTILKTPYGMLCSNCYSLVFIRPLTNKAA